MPTLQIKAARDDSAIAAEIILLDTTQARSTRSVFVFPWTPQDEEDLRWYLEDYPEYAVGPACEIAQRIERGILAKGVLLFQGLFPRGSTAAELWNVASANLQTLRIEIATELELARLPWELLRDPVTQTTPAKSSKAFIRLHPNPARTWSVPEPTEQRIKILLVICRPRGAADVPFRSVASHLIRGLYAGYQGNVSLDVLRPPTYERLTTVLRQAAKKGEPYHIVHFDGHGFSGGVMFENPGRKENSELVDSGKIGSLLGDNRVPLLVLNACRSAYSQAQAKPLAVKDIHEDIRSFGSLAQAVADQGVPGVVAMRFNVFVETASRFMLDFYNSLAEGTTVGDALNGARERLSADPMRDTLPKRVPLEDWLVPVGYELEPLRLFAVRHGKPRLQFNAADIEEARQLDSSLPRRPDVGFFGRDETLLSLDRAFDQHKVVLLHAFAGSGKTATAAEFARWYSQTGGIDGPVLFTSFEAHRTLGQTLEQLGRTFEKELTKAGIHWPTITDPAERRSIALHILRQFSVLWIWDNIEPVTGFPAGTSSAWDKIEQNELADFLRDASDAGAKFLLTSRRDERPWLGELPARITVPPMPFRERFQLANALANKLRRSINEIEDWRPLLDFTQGNPLTITVLVGEALRSNLRTPSQIQTFVEMLRTGTVNIHDEAEEGRSRSLAASLSYGLEHAFQPIQRNLLGLLALFQSVVNVNIFMHLGQGVKAIEEVKNSTEQEVRGIFETASQIGILEKASEFVYKVHPAVPWFFRQTFEAHFKGRERECIESFCNVFMFVGAVLSQQYQEHVPGAAQALYREEANFLHAYELALQWKLWMPAAAVLHAIEDVYLLEARMVEWKILVERLHGLLVKPGTADILPGAEEAWPYLAELLMRIAKAERRFEDAARYAVALVQHHREKADPYVSGQQPTSNGREEIHNLAVMLDTLGSLKAELGSSECLDPLQESLRLAQSINDDVQGAVTLFNIGYCYRDVASIRDFNRAIEWFARALERSLPENREFRGKTLAAIGETYSSRAEELFAAGPERRKEGADYMGNAAQALFAALSELPEFAIAQRAEASVNLGAVLLRAHMAEQSVPLLREGLKLAQEAKANRFVATALFNLTAAFVALQRYDDALAYANAAKEAVPQLGSDGYDMQIRLLELMQTIQQKKDT